MKTRLIRTCSLAVAISVVGGIFFTLTAGAELPLEIADAGTALVPVKQGLGLCDSPVFDAKGNLYFLDRTAGEIWNQPVDGSPAEKLTVKVPGARSISVDRESGFLVVKPKQLSKVGLDGVEAVQVGGDLIGEPEDISVGASGALFFSSGRSGKSVFYRGPDGKRLAQRGIDRAASGLAYLDEKNVLYASLFAEDKVVSFDASTEGFVGKAPKDIAVVPQPGGLTIDTRGNLYVISEKSHSILVFGADGKSLGRVEPPKESAASFIPTNVIFGGEGGKTFFVTGAGGLWKQELKVPGLSR